MQHISVYDSCFQHTYMHTYSQTLLIILIKLFTASYEQSFLTYINVNVFWQYYYI